jgi:hypothetical protein
MGRLFIAVTVLLDRMDCPQTTYVDWGCDSLLYLGKRGLGIKRAELGNAAGGMDYMAVSVCVRRLEGRAQRDLALLTALKRCCKKRGLNEMSNV